MLGLVRGAAAVAFGGKVSARGHESRLGTRDKRAPSALPRGYDNVTDLVSLHTMPTIRRDIYNDALETRPSIEDKVGTRGG